MVSLQGIFELILYSILLFLLNLKNLLLCELDDEDLSVRVHIQKSTLRKPYLGGFRNRKTGKEYHNASIQTHPKPIKDSGVRYDISYRSNCI